MFLPKLLRSLPFHKNCSSKSLFPVIIKALFFSPPIQACIITSRKWEGRASQSSHCVVPSIKGDKKKTPVDAERSLALQKHPGDLFIRQRPKAGPGRLKARYYTQSKKKKKGAQETRYEKRRRKIKGEGDFDWFRTVANSFFCVKKRGGVRVFEGDLRLKRDPNQIYPISFIFLL
ncbi:hypothetical protein CDAR_122411 [Caerostris darwini]|uniref:Uncharacterized protein n=1 Tax=Caerostris darwini TaxID=1538125 RepID=A0AAV4MBN1_9ARAC|nr:hypothetical protein CDAR_122411 [Caerostris darwini]